MTSSPLLPLLIIIGIIIVLVAVGMGTLALLAAIRRKDDTRFLKKAEDRSNRHADDEQPDEQ